MKGFGVDAELHSKEEYEHALGSLWGCMGQGVDEFGHMRYWFTPREDDNPNWIVEGSTYWITVHSDDMADRLRRGGLAVDVVYSPRLVIGTASFGAALQDARG